MAYAEPSSTTTAEARTLGLGLRTRWRVARKPRMVSPRARRRLADDLERRSVTD
jgi:hypothetical protein